MPQGGGTTERLVLVVGHESDEGADLWHLVDALPTAVLAPPGPPLQHGVSELVETGDGPAAVVPMTWGRDPVMVAEAARTVRWLEPGAAEAHIALADPLGTTDDLVNLLEDATTRAHTAAGGGQDAAVVVAARPGRPLDDADLYRVVHLVRASTHLPVEVALVDQPEDLALAVRRARLLGARAVGVVPAGFSPALAGAEQIEDVTFHGPLLDQRDLVRLVERRALEALDRIARGDDGVSRWIHADRERDIAHLDPRRPADEAGPPSRWRRTPWPRRP